MWDLSPLPRYMHPLNVPDWAAVLVLLERQLLAALALTAALTRGAGGRSGSGGTDKTRPSKAPERRDPHSSGRIPQN